MGHANISITLDRYGYLMPGQRQRGHGCLMFTSAPRESGTKKPPARLARCLLAHQLAPSWRTETANRLLLRDRAPRLGMYFI
jgi:hypothetical protein